MTIDAKLKYARTIIPMSEVEPFFGSLVFNAKVEFVDYGDTAWTDGKTVKFNKQFAENLTREEFAGVLLHEVLHIAYLHIPRMLANKYNQRKWNIATDLVINWQIQQLINRISNGGRRDIALPKGVLLNQKYAGMSAEQVYNALPDDISSENDKLNGDLNKEQADAQTVAQAAEEWKALVAQAASQARMRGTIPVEIEREINEILYPKVDWRSKLKEFIQSFPIDYDYTQRDRRFLHERVIIPSLTGEQITGVIALDTSGSISDTELKEFLSETYAILKSFGRVDIWVLSCDAAVHNPQHIESLTDLEDYKPKGGGGTDFRPVFDWVEDNLPNSNFVVYFTDGEGEFGEQPNKPVIWVMTTDKEAPYGITVRY